MSKRYVIGIDLGTTNSSLAYIDLEAAEASAPQLLPLTQWEDEGQSIEDLRLPSFLWLLPKNILKKGLWPHPAFPEHKSPWVLGRLARSKALSAPLEVVHSAKSWLSTGTVQHRTSRILPWGSEGDKLSPLDVQTAILDHIKKVWDVNFPAYPFINQSVVITVPASFDELAQRLTLEAAKRADYPKSIELLEEPLAAYYDWEARHQKHNSRILVCDVGGGTCDFSLLQRSAEGTERIKVSEHLLLGGDNIDLTLAHRLAQRLSPEELPREAWNLLLAQTRRLKEQALNGDQNEVFHLSIPLDSKQLFGSYLSGEVRAEEIRTWVLEDFFPIVNRDERPERQTGLQNWGLPYAKDTAVTRHLAEFIAGLKIDDLLCVGGTLLPELLQKRILENVSAWQSAAINRLIAPESDLAIAYGAARFAALRARSEELIRSPYPRDLLIEVEDKSGSHDLCLMPKGHPRMTPYEVKIPGLHLRLGQEVRFQIKAVQNDGQKLPLPALILKLSKAGKQDLIPVRLLASVRETGVLEVSCHTLDDSEQWILDFAIESGRSQAEASSPLSSETLPSLIDAQKLIRQHYKKESTGSLRIEQLPLALEEIFKLPRDQWSADHLRGLWPTLEAVMFQRSVTPEHEAIWFYLAGFCLRPGFGYRGDEERMNSILRIYDESFRRVDGNAHLLTHWWILWRRLAGGLNTSFQQKLFDRYMPLLRKDKDPSPELIRLLASLERLDKTAKEQLGRLFLNQLKEGLKTHSETRLWGLARLAARYPVYASAAHVLPPSTIEGWSDDLSSTILPSKARPGLFYAWAGRLRGDKQYDIDPAYRQKFLDKVENPEWRKALEVVVTPDFNTQSQMLADTLPSGFVFRQ
ncbi:MAG: Hsp70 family protein [Oligoflexus sp.]|nr:Hsp70 family protein [Oligoflexus sp.]